MTSRFRIAFCGDTSLGTYYLNRSRERYPDAHARLHSDPLSFFTGVLPLVKDSDEVIVNLETVLSSSPGRPLEGKPYPGCDDPEATLQVLEALGVTAVTLANNHTMDFGPQALVKMIEMLEDRGIAVIGAGRNLAEAVRPHVIEVGQKGPSRRVYVFSGMASNKRYRSYGFFASADTPGIASTNATRMARMVGEVKAADPEALVVLCPHWQGIDYRRVKEKHRAWCRQMIDAGADHVVAHGTHRADAVETYRGGQIFYSIGNFVFNSPGRYRKLQAEPVSLVVHADCAEGRPELDFSAWKLFSDNRSSGFRVRVLGPLHPPTSSRGSFQHPPREGGASGPPR